MDFYAIAPKRHLDIVENYDKHLVVAPVLDDPKVFEFYKKLAKNGADIILDNGCAEFGKPCSDKTLLEMARKLPATQIVLPDVWKDVEKTVQKSEQFYYFLKEENVRKDFTLIGVPHGKNLCQYAVCLNQLEGIIDVIGLAYKEWHDRIGLTRQFIAKYACGIMDYEVHMLGLWNVDELKWVQPNVRSFDTSMPFRCAINHYSLSIGTRMYSKMDFDMELKGGQIGLARNNFQTLSFLAQSSYVGEESDVFENIVEDK